MMSSNTHKEQIVSGLNRLLFPSARARRSAGTRFDEPLNARSFSTDHVLIVHRGREHGDGGAVRLMREVGTKDYRFLLGKPARQVTSGSRERAGLETEVLTRELGAARRGRDQSLHLAESVPEWERK